MAKVSVLIPSRCEQFLPQTVADVLAKARGEIEVVVTLEGYWPDPPLPDDPRLRLVHFGVPHGMRAAINAAADVATGDYFCKLDAHCLVGEGFDEILKRDYAEENWVMVPRRFSLDPIAWCVKKDRACIDYHYLSYFFADPNNFGLHGRAWDQRKAERRAFPIDDEMSSQGSCWFMSRRHWNWLGGLSTDGYGDFIQEFQEVGCKTWLGGGAVKVNKNTFYAHLHKGSTFGRGYKVSKSSWDRGLKYSADLWVNNRWPGRIHDFSWLVERFWPVPTWPEDRAKWTLSTV